MDLLEYKKAVLLHALLLAYIGVRPIMKYYETINLLPRINFTLVMIIGLGGYVLFAIRYIKQSRIFIKPIRQLSSCLLIYIVLIQIIYLPSILMYGISLVNYIHITSETIIASMIMWLIGSKINILESLLNNHKIKNITFGLFMLFIVTIFIGVTLRYVYNYGSGFYIYLNGAQNYLMIADSFAVFSLLIINYTKKKKNKFILFFISAVCLYSTLSRTSLYAFLLVSIISYSIKSFNYGRRYKIKHSKILIQLTFFIVLIILIITIYDDIRIRENFDFVNDNRMFRIIFNRDSDISATSRDTILDKGIEDIKNNIFFGNFMVEIKRNGSSGGYIHNYLSYWQQYGIIVFIVLNFIYNF